MPHRRPPRLADECYVGARRVFFTMCAFERRNYFSDVARGDQARTHLLSSAARWDVEAIAYCFMPDHLHVLVEGKSVNASALKFAETFRQRSGFNHRSACATRLWQEGYYDHVLRAEDATIAVVRYIVLNPVRAGLCADATTYPLLGSSRYELSELVTAVDWYPPSPG
jgi:putative transposase